MLQAQRQQQKLLGITLPALLLLQSPAVVRSIYWGYGWNVSIFLATNRYDQCRFHTAETKLEPEGAVSVDIAKASIILETSPVMIELAADYELAIDQKIDNQYSVQRYFH